MKVHLAGFNVDTQVLREMQNVSGRREDLTPEVISAAYARISRDPRSIGEIRSDARNEVERTRRSNSTIIFKMGHHSVAEHAVFNLDIVGVSRYVMEELEKFRLCSYTEKSQRYITLNNDFIVPDEMRGTELEQEFVDMIRTQNQAYFTLFEKLKQHVFEKYSTLAQDPRKHNLLEGWAKEDARYITSLATQSQVGQTMNARTAELLLRRFASHPLSEVKKVGKEIYRQIAQVAPSIVIFHQANDRDEKTYPAIKELVKDIIEKNMISQKEESRDLVRIVDYTENADVLIAAALMHTTSSLPYEQCKEVVANLSQKRRHDMFKASWQNLQLYDSVVREFEYVNLTYSIALSAACFGQLKRHRMSTITSQEYDPNLGVTIPESVKEIGMEQFFQDIVDKTNGVYDKISKQSALAAPYILTNAHRKRVLMRLNVRELYHISRLREDAHAQWDVQNISRKMTEKAKQIMPMTCDLIGGKDKYNETYKRVFNTFPAVKEVELPQPRTLQS